MCHLVSRASQHLDWVRRHQRLEVHWPQPSPCPSASNGTGGTRQGSLRMRSTNVDPDATIQGSTRRAERGLWCWGSQWQARKSCPSAAERQPPALKLALRCGGGLVRCWADACPGAAWAKSDYHTSLEVEGEAIQMRSNLLGWDWVVEGKGENMVSQGNGRPATIDVCDSGGRELVENAAGGRRRFAPPAAAPRSIVRDRFSIDRPVYRSLGIELVVFKCRANPDRSTATNCPFLAPALASRTIPHAGAERPGEI